MASKNYLNRCFQFPYAEWENWCMYFMIICWAWIGRPCHVKRKPLVSTCKHLLDILLKLKRVLVMVFNPINIRETGWVHSNIFIWKLQEQIQEILEFYKVWCENYYKIYPGKSHFLKSFKNSCRENVRFYIGYLPTSEMINWNFVKICPTESTTNDSNVLPTQI